MADAGDDTDVKRMRLRYAGTCRLCGLSLAAGTDAMYERALRAVRCVSCAVPTSTGAPATDPVQLGLDENHARSRDPLRLRTPASAVITETLRMQAQSPPLSRAARLFGKHPLSPEANPWFLGALGELEVGRRLAALGPDWVTVHAIPIGSRGSDIDHLVIGPRGVFTINTKRHEGQVWVGSRRLLVNGQRTDHLRNAEHEARRVATLLSAAARRPVAVTPIVAIVGARSITIKERPDKVVLLRSGDLVGWLHRRPSAFAPAEVKELGEHSVDPLTWGTSEPESPDLHAFAELRESIASALQRRRLWGLASALVIIGAALIAGRLAGLI